MNYIYKLSFNFQYTQKEIEWYGLTYKEAILKLKDEMKANNVIEPLKIEFRKNIIDHLKATSEANQQIEEEKRFVELLIRKQNRFIIILESINLSSIS